MKTIRIALLAGAAALLLSGCVGYGPHGGWGHHRGHMDGYRTGYDRPDGYGPNGYPGRPCDPDGDGVADAGPCRR